MIFGSFARNLSVFGAGFALLAIATPVLPQDGNDEARLRRLEAEVRALQRKVFPGGDGRFFEPEMTAQPSVNSTTSGTSTTAVTDILARLDALEAQLQRQTALNEENANAVRQLSERLDAVEGRGASAGGTAGAGRWLRRNQPDRRRSGWPRCRRSQSRRPTTAAMTNIPMASAYGMRASSRKPSSS